MACDKDGGRAEEMARKYSGGYWHSVVKHYEIGGSHFEQTKSHEYYQRMTDTIGSQGVDAVTAFFLNLQVWGTPEQCLDRIKDIHARTDCCGLTGVFSCAARSEAVARGNMELFAKEIVPELKKLRHRPVFDTEVDGLPAFARTETKAA